jgi:hypothetical protein
MILGIFNGRKFTAENNGIFGGQKITPQNCFYFRRSQKPPKPTTFLVETIKNRPIFGEIFSAAHYCRK